MKPSKTLAGRQDDLVEANRTCFDAQTKLSLITHAINRINDTLASCELLGDIYEQTPRMTELLYEMADVELDRIIDKLDNDPDVLGDIEG